VVRYMEHQTDPAAGGGHADGEAAYHARPAAPSDAPEDRSASETPAEAAATSGEPRVDAALALLDRLPDLPVSEHAELFEQVHAQLSEVLGDLDSGSAGPVGG
jgi:hypothetical protein